jgi:hypothetical protein
MASAPLRPSAKLFHVLVAGGLAMATPACSSDPVEQGVDAGNGKDGAAGGSDARADAAIADSGLDDALSAADACLNRPGDCTHGLCSW